MPKYLAEADLPGTYGFDPLRLGTNPDNLKWCALAAGDAQPACRQCCVHPASQCVTEVHLAMIRYAEAEKTNGRWAMAACAGILFTDAVGLPNWVNAGAEVGGFLPAAEHAHPSLCTISCCRCFWPCLHMSGASADRYSHTMQADMILPLPTLIGLEVVIFALLEYKRYEGFKKTGKVCAGMGPSMQCCCVTTAVV